jgi:ParB family transcriptional regulator, chromosome partitioning protein
MSAAKPRKAADLVSRLGGNMAESVGATADISDVGFPASSVAPVANDSARFKGTGRLRGAMTIPVDRITPDPDQPRKEFDREALEQLAASLRDRGQVQPIRVRWNADLGKWIIIAGERRWRAAQIAGLESLACVEAQGAMTADEVLEEQLVENCLREDLKPIEQAHAFKSLTDRRGWSYAQVAEHLHISKAAVGRAIALLDLPADIQERVDAGVIAPSLAAELTKVENSAEQRILADEAAAGRLTRDEVMRRRAAKRCATPTRATFKFDDSTVQVTIDRPDAPHEAVVARLLAALWKATSGRQGAPLEPAAQDAA